MTIDQFLEKLKQTPRTWRIDQIGWIRNGSHCPLLFIAADDSIPSWKTTRAAQVCGLSFAEGEAIATAADRASGYDRDLRQQLLDACGLADHLLRTGE